MCSAKVPFTNAVPVEGADGYAIDPAVLLDDDVQVYYYWGQFHLRGAKLRPDLINEVEHGFDKGSIRKRNGLYYLIYADIKLWKCCVLRLAHQRVAQYVLHSRRSNSGVQHVCVSSVSTAAAVNV